MSNEVCDSGSGTFGAMGFYRGMLEGCHATGSRTIGVRETLLFFSELGRILLVSMAHPIALGAASLHSGKVYDVQSPANEVTLLASASPERLELPVGRGAWGPSS